MVTIEINRNNVSKWVNTTQPAITCSKLTIETLEQLQARLSMWTFEVVLLSLLLTFNIFHTLFRVSIVNFEHLNPRCE